MDTIRTGRISSINREEGRARVLFDRDTGASAEFPFLFSEIYPYKVDDLVYIAKLSGTSAEAVIIGLAFADETPPAETMKEGLYRKDLSRTAGKAYIRYDESTDTIEITAAGNIKVTAGGTLNITASGGDVTVNGVSLTKHTHTAPDGETSVPN